MSMEPIQIQLSPAMKLDFVKRKLREKAEELAVLETEIRELVTKQAELAYFEEVAGQQYANPDGVTFAKRIADLEQKRQWFYYLVQTLEAQIPILAQSIGGSVGAGKVETAADTLRRQGEEAAQAPAQTSAADQAGPAGQAAQGKQAGAGMSFDQFRARKQGG